MAWQTQAQSVAKTPFCEGIPLKDCLSEHIAEAEVIFEGTVLESTRYLDKDSIWKIKTVFAVEKVFKGNVKGDMITQIDSIEKLISYYSAWHLKKYREYAKGVTIAPLKSGTTSIVMGMYKYHEQSDTIESLFGTFNLEYQMGYAYYPFPTEKEHYILHFANNIDEILFRTTADLYEFLISQPNIKFQDYTHKQFIKPTFEEWKKIKKKNEKSGNAAQDGQNVLKEEPDIPTITSFSPNVPGGVDNILTINGTNFGLPPFPGFNLANIWFEASSYNGSIIKLDNFDLTFGLISWTPTEIKIKLPGDVNDLKENSNFWLNVPLMSARLKVFTANGDATEWTDEKLNIRFSARQNIQRDGINDANVASKERVKITTPESDGIFYFYVSNEIYNDCILMNQINKALKEWKCKTGIDWRVKEKTSTNAGGQDNKSLFFFGSTCCAVAFPTFGQTCSDNNYEVYENDIEICPTIGSDPFCSGSTFGILPTILHELGHVHGLNHTLPGGGVDLMNLPSMGGTASSITADDLDGATVIANFSNANCKENIDFTSFGDYAMRDNTGDMGTEPNCSAVNGSDPILYNSPDLWNCHNSNNACVGANEMPKEGQTNYMNARVKNISADCSAQGGKVEFYWTIGSTGEIWPTDWIDHYWSTSNCLIGDFAGAANIGVLAPNEAKIVSVPWEAPLIDELIDCGVPRYPWDVENGNYQVCLLARVGSTKDYNFLEQQNVLIGENVRNSNHIITKNTGLLDDGFFTDTSDPNDVSFSIGTPTWIFFSNNNHQQQNLDLVLSSLPDNTDFDFQYIELLLSDDLFTKLTSVENDFTIPSPNVIRLKGTGNFVIPSITMSAGEMHLIGIRVVVSEEDLLNYETTNKNQTFYITHRSSVLQNSINPSSVCYFTTPEITKSEPTDHRKSTQKQGADIPQYGEVLVFDILGRLVSTVTYDEQNKVENFDNQLPNGVYFMVYRSKNGVQRVKKVTLLR